MLLFQRFSIKTWCNMAIYHKDSVVWNVLCTKLSIWGVDIAVIADGIAEKLALPIAKFLGVGMIGMNKNFLEKEWIDFFTQHELLVAAWTVNTLLEKQKFKTMGVRMLITDCPTTACPDEH